MPRYIVKSPLRNDGEDYAEGKAITLSEEQAEAIGEAIARALESRANPIEPVKPLPKGKKEDDGKGAGDDKK